MALAAFFIIKNDGGMLTLDREFAHAAGLGEEIKNSLRAYPPQPLSESSVEYSFSERTATAPTVITASSSPEEKNKAEETRDINFPKNYMQPVELKLDNQRTVKIIDKDNLYYETRLIYDDSKSEVESAPKGASRPPFERKASDTAEKPQDTRDPKYVRYKSDDSRKTVYYTYQKRPETGLRQMKSWVYYAEGTGQEKEEYSFENAQLRLNNNGEVEGYYRGEQEVLNDNARQQVDSSLFERARLTLEKEAGQDIEKGNRKPDFIIPRPYFLDKDKNKTDLDWKISNDKKSLTVELISKTDKYPLALDPTLQFTAPGQLTEGDVIDSTSANSNFSESMATGDLNNDGLNDLVVGARYEGGAAVGAAYIFYQKRGTSTIVDAADVTIAGEAFGDEFGGSVYVDDFNADGKADLAVGASKYSEPIFEGHVYLFYNDGSYPSVASSADVKITGEDSSRFGLDISSGDFNNDNKIDLVVSGPGGGIKGKVYIFYNDGNYPLLASSADSIINGEANGDYFGNLSRGDLNNDGKNDLIVSAPYGAIGKVYIFYNDGSITATASTADAKVNGESGSYFGNSLDSADFNADGKADLAVAGSGYGTSTGRIYLLYNDGSIPTTASTADVKISGEVINGFFGSSLAGGDFNADGKVDLVVGANSYYSDSGRVYIFYNDGSYPTAASSGDVIITGESDSDYFGTKIVSGDLNGDGKYDLVVGSRSGGIGGRAYVFYSNNGFLDSGKTVEDVYDARTGGPYFGGGMTAGDFNSDGRTDLAVSAPMHATNTGRAFVFYNDGSFQSDAAEADITITGEAQDNYFGRSFAVGDYNSDGKADLVIGAEGYNSNTGRAYIFYFDGSVPSSAASADKIITGQGGQFGFSLSSGDLNSDNKDDLAVGAFTYNSNAGRAYIFYNDGTIPSSAASADLIISGEGANNKFGESTEVADFNNDGKKDLVVGASRYNTYTGRVYFFYNDSSMATSAAAADLIITGATTSQSFGGELAVGDLNDDGRPDLAVVAQQDATYSGRIYIFYGSTTMPTTASSADLSIAGEASGWFGWATSMGDYNNDGRDDLAVGAAVINSNKGGFYIFYGSTTMPTTASTADVFISGSATNRLGASLSSGDFNADGTIDIAVGADDFGNDSGAAFIFNNDGSMPTSATTADTIIYGEKYGPHENSFGAYFSAGDLNNDGKTDLVVGATAYKENTGKIYVFFNDGKIPENTATADAVIVGESENGYFGRASAIGDINADGAADLAVGAFGYANSVGRVYAFYGDGLPLPSAAISADLIVAGQTGSSFGNSMEVGDLNNDGEDDLIVGGVRYSAFTGRVYVFYGSTTLPSTASTADVLIAGQSTSNFFGYDLELGDFNGDDKTDLAVGASRHASYTGRAYIFYGSTTMPTTASTADVMITGESPNSNFGEVLAANDLNLDGKDDLVVSASGYLSYTGRVYVFYSSTTMPTTASTADVIITGEAVSGHFGNTLSLGDFNADSRPDIAAGAYGHASSTGRAYVFYNDGAIPSLASSSDVYFTGSAVGDDFGYSIVAGNFDVSGRVVLVVGASGYDYNQGAVYFYLTNTAPPAGTSIHGNIKAWGNVKVW